MENASTVQPTRIRLLRHKGYRLQEVSLASNGLPAIKVDRTTQWGNPFLVESMGRDAAVAAFRRLITGDMSDAELREHSGAGPGWKERRAELLRDGTAIRTWLPELRGTNLACWCRLDEPCHADVLLELANTPD
jgi:hypothetical protein